MLLSWAPGNGKTIRFWIDKWSPLGRICVLYPELYSSFCFKNCSLRDFVTSHLGRLNDPVFSSDVEGINQIIRELNWTTFEGHDTLHWNAEPNKIYSVKSFYLAHDWVSPTDRRFNRLNSVHLPPNGYIFAWTMIQDGIPTMERIAARFPNWQLDLACKRCNNGTLESIYHLFVDCPTSQRTWELVSRYLRKDIRLTVTLWMLVQSSIPSHDMLLDLIAIITCREIWNGRNHLLFRGNEYLPLVIADRAINFLHNHLAASNDKHRLPLASSLHRLSGVMIQPYSRVP